MKLKRPTVFETFAASLITGVFAFVFLYAIELVLTYWLSHKLHYSKILYYLGAYAIIGVAYGTGVGAAHVLLVRLGRRLVPTRAEPLFYALTVSGFLCFLALIVLNAAYLPYSPLLSTKSLSVNVALVFLCTALFFSLYISADKTSLSMPVYRTMSVSGSTAAAVVIFHGLVSRHIDRAGVELSHAAGLTLLFVLTGSLAALADAKLGSLIAGKKEGSDRESCFKRLFFGKVILVAVVLGVIMFAKRYQPLVAEDRTAQSAETVGDNPNIIIIVLDTVRQDRLSTYGGEHETSPNITELANQSWVFDAYATASWTLPSHASIVTGLYPTENGTGPQMNYEIDPRNETIAEILKENGYSTAAFISNYCMLGNSSGFSQGFDFYYANSRERGLAFSLFASYLFTKFLPDSLAFELLPFKRAENINKMAIRWVKEKSGKPFFLFLNYMDAHFPYVPPHPYNRFWFSKPAPAGSVPDDKMWTGIDHDLGSYEGKMADVMREYLSGRYDVRAMPREISIMLERAYLLGQYDGEIAYLDAQLGSLFQQLKKSGVYDDSLIILTSDHGEFFFEHGMRLHLHTLYQEVVRVPLIVKPPASRGERPARIPEPVSLVDLFHSVLEYVGIPHKAREGSRNLFERKSSPIFSEAHLREGYSRDLVHRFGEHIYSLTENDYKLIYSSKQTYELYDLSKDPMEKRNLISDDLAEDVRDVFARMKPELDSRIERVNAGMLVTEELSPEKLDELRPQLKALGYMQ